jgi:hypothetical protein
MGCLVRFPFNIGRWSCLMVVDAPARRRVPSRLQYRESDRESQDRGGKNDFGEIDRHGFPPPVTGDTGDAALSNHLGWLIKIWRVAAEEARRKGRRLSFWGTRAGRMRRMAIAMFKL